VNLLDVLSRIDPIFSNWLIADHPNSSFGDETTDLLNIKAVSLASARARIAEIIENNVARNMPAIVTYPLYKAGLLAINAIWRAPWSCAYAFRSGSISVPIEFAPGVVATQIKSVTQVPLDPTYPNSIFHIPGLPAFRPNTPPASRCRETSSPNARRTAGL
jgi:hypothetical protein